MITKTIKYHDYEGKEREDDFYFNLTQVELSKINSDPSFPNGIEDTINRAVKNEDRGEMLRIIDMVISRSYGAKLPDGSFVKRNVSGMPLYEVFVNTEAYDNLLTELLQGGDRTITEFLMGCLPTNAREAMQKRIAERKENDGVKLTLVKDQGSK